MGMVIVVVELCGLAMGEYIAVVKRLCGQGKREPEQKNEGK